MFEELQTASQSVSLEIKFSKTELMKNLMITTKWLTFNAQRTNKDD